MFELRLKPERLTREIVRFLDEVFADETRPGHRHVFDKDSPTQTGRPSAPADRLLGPGALMRANGLLPPPPAALGRR